MQETHEIPDFVEKLYALKSRKTSDDGSDISLTEDESGVISEDGDDFFYNIGRKIHGLAELHELLARKGLVLDVVDEIKTVQKTKKIFPRIIVQRSSDADLYKDLTFEQKTAFNELIQTDALRGRKNCVRALVTKDFAGMEAADALDTMEATAAESAIDKAAKTQLDLEIQYLQMQLDIIFSSTVEVNAETRKIHNIIAKLKDEERLSELELNILFDFIEHTYGSVQNFLEDVNPVDPFLLEIHNSLLGDHRDVISALYTATMESVLTKDITSLSKYEKILFLKELKRFNIDPSKTKKEDLEGEARRFFETIEGKLGQIKDFFKKDFHTVSVDDVKNFGKVLISRKLFENISKNKDLEESFEILDGQTDNGLRLRTCYDAPREEISILVNSFLWKHGLENTEQISGINLKDLQTNSVKGSNEASLKQQFRPHQPLLRGNREYNEGLMLEEGHVIAITNKLLDKQNVPDTSVRFISVNPENEHHRMQFEEVKKSALIEAAKGTPIALQISNGGHWITVCLLPVIEADGVKKVKVVSMDSMGSCALSKDLMTDLKEKGKKIKLEVSDLHNMSVNDQQKSMCCGFATAVNGFSILKTFRDLDGKLPIKEDGGFDEEGFKERLLPNVLYRSGEITVDGNKFSGTILYGNKPAPKLSTLDFVRQFGGMILQEVASPESSKEFLAKDELKKLKKLDVNQVTLEPQETDFVADSSLIVKLLDGRKTATEEDEILADYRRIKSGGKFYDLSADEYQKAIDVKFWQGLDAILDKGPLDNLLNNEKTRRLFVKLLNQSFANDKNPHTKKFDKIAGELGKIIHIDEEIKGKINAVILEAQQENPNVELSWVDAILLFLYNLPLLGRLVEMSGAEIVKVASMVDKLEHKIETWEKYTSTANAFNTLIPTA